MQYYNLKKKPLLGSNMQPETNRTINSVLHLVNSYLHKNISAPFIIKIPWSRWGRFTLYYTSLATKCI